MTPRLLPFALVAAALFLFNYDLILEDVPPVIEKSCHFLSFLCLTIGIGWLYTSVHRNPKRAVLKILDWALICFILCMIPLYEVLNLSAVFWNPLLAGCLAARLIISWWIKK